MIKLVVEQRGVDFKKALYPKIAFTGHRPDKLGGYKAGRNNPIREAIKKKLSEVCYYFNDITLSKEFMVGGAQGIDQDAADVILSMIDIGRAVALNIAIPYPGQESPWPEEAQKYYKNQLDRIMDQDYYEEGEGSYIHHIHTEKPKSRWEAVKWLDERNHYMVDWCDLLIAVWDGTEGGTDNCIEYAKKVGKPILLIRIVRE